MKYSQKRNKMIIKRTSVKDWASYLMKKVTKNSVKIAHWRVKAVFIHDICYKWGNISRFKNQLKIRFFGHCQSSQNSRAASLRRGNRLFPNYDVVVELDFDRSALGRSGHRARFRLAEDWAEERLALAFWELELWHGGLNRSRRRVQDVAFWKIYK